MVNRRRGYHVRPHKRRKPQREGWYNAGRGKNQKRVPKKYSDGDYGQLIHAGYRLVPGENYDGDRIINVLDPHPILPIDEKAFGLKINRNGNFKISSHILIWKLQRGPPSRGGSCPGATEDCKRYCYSGRGHNAVPKNTTRRYANVYLSKQSDFVRKMSEIIKDNLKDYVRIHEDGDFYSPEYFMKWMRIILNNPNVNFLAYTRSPFVLDMLRLVPPNLSLLFSLDKSTPSSLKEEVLRSNIPIAWVGKTNDFTLGCKQCPHDLDRLHGGCSPKADYSRGGGKGDLKYKVPCVRCWARQSVYFHQR